VISSVVAVMIVTGGALTVRSLIQRPVLTDHYRELRDKGLVKLKEMKLGLVNEYRDLNIVIRAKMPIFFEVRHEDIDRRTFSRIQQHLNSSKSFSKEIREKSNYAYLIQEHNRNARSIMYEIEKSADLCIARFPMLQESFDEKPIPRAIYNQTYVRDNIIRAIQAPESMKIYETNDSELIIKFGKDRIVARIEGNVVRNLFLGELKATILKHKEQVEGLDGDARQIQDALSEYKRFLDQVIDRINNRNELEGKSDVEKGA